MAEYIEREAIKQKKVYSEERHEYVVPVAEIDWQPAADVVEVVHARWIAPLFGHFDTPVTCSRCNTLHRIPTCFCSACGAKMDGEGREQ